MGYTYNKLKGRIKEKYGTQENFAKALGVSQQCVSQKLLGKVGFSQKDIEQWAKLLGISKREYGRFFFT